MKSSLLLIAFVLRLLVMLSLFCAISPSAQGQVSFFTPPTYAGSGNLFVADFNGDGKPDLLSVDGTLQLGKGDGTFTSGTAVTGTPLAVADFNGDGKPDILEQGLGTLQVLLGNGDGTFQAPVSTNSGASLAAVTAADLRGNGKIDVLGVFNNTLLVYLGKGDGTFAAGVAYNLGVSSVVLANILVDDFNGDKKMDVAVIIPGQVIVLLGNGDGTLQSPLSSPRVDSWSAVAGDFNGDGKLDLAFNGGTGPGSTVSVMLGNGDGTFQAPKTAFSGGGSALAAADLNGDGKLDLVLLTNLIEIRLGNGDGTFSNPRTYMPAIVPPCPPCGSSLLAIADFNGDGKLDIAAGNNVLLGNGDGTFQGQPATHLDAGCRGPAVVGNFRKKGIQDIAMIGGNNVCLYTNDGTGVLTLAHTYTLQQPANDLAVADLNGDGNLDLFVVGGVPDGNWSYSVLLGNGDGSFQPPSFSPQSVSTTSGVGPVVIADFNNDGKPDVAVALGESQSQSLAVLLGNGDGSFASPSYVFDGGASLLVSGDFNRDGNIDLAASGNSGAAILFGNGNGTFQPATFPSNLQYGVFAAADFNGDGKVDLVGANQVFLGNGDGTFTAAGSPLPYGDGIGPPLADFNGDGKLDAWASHGGFDDGVSLGNGDGTFGPFIHVILFNKTLVLPTFELAADMDGDGKPDLIFGDNSARMFVMRNTTPFVADFRISASALSPASVTAGGSATSMVTLAAMNGFNGSIALSCSGLPSGASCSFNPSSLGSGSGTSALTVTTTARTTAANRAYEIWAGLSFAMGLTLMSLPWWPRGRRPHLTCGIALLCLLSMGVVLSACGGGAASGSGGGHSSSGTPAGTYTVAVSGTSVSGSASGTHTTQINLVVQ